MNEAQSLLFAWLGKEEYQEAWHRSHSWSFRFRFRGRLLIAALGLGAFLWQQLFEPPQGWVSDVAMLLVLLLGISQAAGPLFYLLYQVTQRVFFTQHYREALKEGRFYLSLKSALYIVLMTALSCFAAWGWLGSRWHIKLLVFLLTVPVFCFWLLLPALNYLVMRVRRQPGKRLIHKALPS